jgi:cell shape-determining protein MreC
MIKKRIRREKQSNRRAWKYFFIVFSAGMIIAILAYITAYFIAEEFKLVSSIMTFAAGTGFSLFSFKDYDKRINRINRLIDIKPLYKELEEEFKQLEASKLKSQEKTQKLQILEKELDLLEKMFLDIYGNSGD